MDRTIDTFTKKKVNIPDELQILLPEEEKPQGEGSKINGGFFVLCPSVLNYITGDNTIWEKEPLEALADENNLAAYTHRGFWHPMDTLRDKNYLEELWINGHAPWKTWR